MITFAEGVAQATRGTLCAVMAVNDNINRLFAKIGADPFGFYPAMSGLRRQLCSDDPDNDPIYVPEFTGGQCVGVNYNVTILRENYPFSDCSTLGPVSTTNTYLGPIRGLVTRTENPSGPLCTPGGNAVYLRYGSNPIQESPVAGAGYGATASITSVVRADALPDDCGDPPPVIGPPGDVIVEGDNITYNIDESTEITVPISFVFAPAYVDLDGSVTVPVNIDVGGIEFSGTVEIAPEFNLTIKPKGLNPSPGAPDDPDEIGEPGEPSTPIDDEEELESTIVGVLVYSDIDPDGLPSSILFPDGPNIYVPRLASVQFAVKTQNSIGWTPDQDVKNLECYVPCPAPQGAIAVRVSPMPGVTSRFTPVRGLPLTSF